MIIRKTTKEIFAESLQELSLNKSVDKITIKEIAQNCGMTATTFYNHFSDKYELLAWIYNTAIDPYYGKLGDGASWRECVRQSSLILLGNREFYRNALKNTIGQTSFRYATNNYAVDLLMERIRLLTSSVDIPEEVQFYVRFYMRAISESINDWFLKGEKIPLEEFTDLLVHGMPMVLRDCKDKHGNFIFRDDSSQ